jgi:hypothetical protein
VIFLSGVQGEPCTSRAEKSRRVESCHQSGGKTASKRIEGNLISPKVREKNGSLGKVIFSPILS